MTSHLRNTTLTVAQWRVAVAKWNAKSDTSEIASFFGVHESVIYNSLFHWLKQAKTGFVN